MEIYGFVNLNKLYVVGGEFDDWKKDYYKKDILWIYDIDKNEWELNENKSTFQNNQEEHQSNKNKSKNESRINLKNINQNNIKKDEKRNKIISNAKINRFKDNQWTLSSKNFLKKNKIIGKEERKVGFLKREKKELN